MARLFGEPLVKLRSVPIEDNGEPLDMVSPYEMGDTSAPMITKGLSETALANRKLLVETLEAVGLTNYAGEWWHWSWGDSGWALRVGAAKAV